MGGGRGRKILPRDLAEIWTDKSIYGILIVVFYGGIIGLFFEIIGRFYGFVKEI